MRLTKGTIIEIHAHDEYYVYAQVLHKGCIAYYDGKYDAPIENIEDLSRNSVLFVLSSSIVRQRVENRWVVRGRLEIPQELQTLPMQFIQDAIDPHKFSLYNCETGEITKATRAECEGLERCAIWYDNHIEDRIDAYYTGTKCAWLITIDDWIKLNTK